MMLGKVKAWLLEEGLDGLFTALICLGILVWVFNHPQEAAQTGQKVFSYFDWF